MFFQDGSKYLTEDIEYICELMFQILKSPIYFWDNNKDIFFSYGHLDNPLHPNKKDLFTELFSDVDAYSFPVIKSTKYYENYFAVNLKYEDIFIGTFIVGPTAYSPISSETVQKLLSDKNIPLGYKKELIDFYNSIPVIEYNRLISAGLMLHYSIYNERLDIAEVMEKNSLLNDMVKKINTDTNNSITEHRQETLFHHSLEHEKKIKLYIKDGNIEKLKQVLVSPMDGSMGILSKNNPLRNQKNLSICGVTLATRAAIEGGIDSEYAFSLSDSYIQALEEIDDIKDLIELYSDALCDFASKVKEVKKSKYPKVIFECQEYISKHLYDNFSVSQISKFVNLNQNYLSELFTKSVGKTLSEYILEQKINEAKKLLEFSTYSLLDISTWLNFHDQSHFTRVFKKLTGITPKKYRDINAAL